MIIIKLQGALGNQLFQYAFGRLFGILNKEEVRFFFGNNKNDVQRKYTLEKFNVRLSLLTDDEAKNLGFGLASRAWRKITKNYHIGYEEGLLYTKKKYLEGYFHSYKYLEPIRDILQTEITLREPIEKKYSEIIEKMKNTGSVALHVRRGDYVTNTTYSPCGIEYYARALQMIKERVENPTVFLFSDDISWCQENIKTDIPITFMDNVDYEDFSLGTNCKHDIISNSSYSFWIAWLNKNPNKIVIAPKNWSRKYESEYRDMCPEDWIRI